MVFESDAPCKRYKSLYNLINSHKLNILCKLYVEMFLFKGPQFRRREIYVIGDILRLFSVKVKGAGGIVRVPDPVFLRILRRGWVGWP